MSVANQQHLFTGVCFSVSQTSVINRGQGTLQGGMYAEKYLNRTEGDVSCCSSAGCPASSGCWAECRHCSLRPKPQCIPLPSTKFLNNEKVMLKSCTFVTCSGESERLKPCVLWSPASPSQRVPVVGVSRGSGPGVKPPSAECFPSLPSLVPLIQPSEPHPTGGSGEPTLHG